MTFPEFLAEAERFRNRLSKKIYNKVESRVLMKINSVDPEQLEE